MKNRTATANGRWVKVEAVGRNFGFVAVVQHRNGRYIDETPTYPTAGSALAAGIELAAK